MSKIDNVLRNTLNIAIVVFAVSVIITSVAGVSFTNAGATSKVDPGLMVPANPMPVESAPALRDIVGDEVVLVQVIEFEEPMYINARPLLNN